MHHELDKRNVREWRGNVGKLEVGREERGKGRVQEEERREKRHLEEK